VAPITTCEGIRSSRSLAASSSSDFTASVAVASCAVVLFLLVTRDAPVAGTAQRLLVISFLPLNRLQLSFYNYSKLQHILCTWQDRLMTRSSNSTRLFHAKSDTNFLVQVSVWSYIVPCLHFVKNLQKSYEFKQKLFVTMKYVQLCPHESFTAHVGAMVTDLIHTCGNLEWQTVCLL
jgi:hypothetical protein